MPLFDFSWLGRLSLLQSNLDTWMNLRLKLNLVESAGDLREAEWVLYNVHPANVLCVSLQEQRTVSSWTCCFPAASVLRRSNSRPSWSMNTSTTSNSCRPPSRGWMLIRWDKREGHAFTITTENLIRNEIPLKVTIEKFFSMKNSSGFVWW